MRSTAVAALLVLLAAASAASLAFATPALAQTESSPPPAGAPPGPAPMAASPTNAAPPPAPEAPKRVASITFSPIHLLFPIVEVTGEIRLHDKIGVAGILGYGAVSAVVGNENRRFRAWEAGAHFNYYVLGSFDHGMQLGVEAIYLKIATNDDVRITGTGDGLAVGPYVGYKIITRVGFTFEANAGAQFATARASATDGTNSASGTKSRVLPLVNLNVGWSF